MMDTNTLSEMALAARTQLARLQALKGGGASYDDCKAAAEEYIRLNAAWQKARFGRVRQRISTGYLLRAV